MAIILIWLIPGAPGYAPAMAVLRLGSILEVRCFGFQIHVSVRNHYADVPREEAHPDDVTAHLWPVDGDRGHSLPAPLMLPHSSSSCRETSLSPEGAEMPSDQH